MENNAFLLYSSFSNQIRNARFLFIYAFLSKPTPEEKSSFFIFHQEGFLTILLFLATSCALVAQLLTQLLHLSAQLDGQDESENLPI